MVNITETGGQYHRNIHLTVLDFVGNSRPEYNFENKFRALIGKTSTTVKKEIEDNFPHLPLGCSIILERKAKDVILSNIITATSLISSKSLRISNALIVIPFT